MAETQLAKLGRYRIVEELGRGAMGIVYRAEDSMLNRTVAIKTVILSADAEERADYEARFLQEAKAAGGLNHPNIITIHDIGREGDVVYMAMELLDGVELRSLMGSGRLSLPRALNIAAQVAEGLSFAHKNGVVHRDIKPANIMVMADDRAKIMDFGIAKVRLSDVKTQAGSVLGSPKYMSPEQIGGQRADHRSDIFSLGVTLYEMVAGAAPFTAANVAQLMYQVTNTAARPPSLINASLPTMLDLIVARALEKDPGKRYQDVREFAIDLRACLLQPGETSTFASAPPRSATAPDEGDDKTVRIESGEGYETTRKVPSDGISERPIDLLLDKTSPPPNAATNTAVKNLIPGAGPASGSTGLSPARRIDSTAALKQLAEAAMADGKGRRGTAPSRIPRHRFLADPLQRRLAVAVVAALVAAIAIALL